MKSLVLTVFLCLPGLTYAQSWELESLYISGALHKANYLGITGVIDCIFKNGYSIEIGSLEAFREGQIA